MKQLLIVKTGTAYTSIAKKHGDFEGSRRDFHQTVTNN